MANKSLTPQEQEKSDKLTDAVAYKTADEVREVYKSLGRVEFTARALACACRYRGLEHVRALVECGAAFDYDRTDVMHTYDFHLSLINFDHLPTEGGEKLPVLPLEERIRIAEYLCENAESAGFDGGELLYYSILTKNFDMANALKKAGAELPEKYVKLLSEGAKGVPGGTFLWYEYCMVLGDTHNRDKLQQLGLFREALGDKTLNFTDTIYASIGSRNFYDPKLFGFFLSIFNTSKMNKTHMLKIIIKNNLIPDLEIAAALGWLKQPRKRDEMIEYAAENGCTEASAWLLDFKNRTADLAAEQAKAEKKMMSELNADPNSVSELSKVWSYKKREDGTLVITSYKGNKEEVTVPERIGKQHVTAIGAYALSPHAPRVREEQADNRRRIRKVTLPDSITEIGGYAFYMCKSLEEINIPDGVTELRKDTFAYSGLKSVTLPNSVRAIGEAAFASCDKMESVNIPQGVPEIQAYAFSHCRSLKEVEIPGSVTALRTWAFINCEGLTKVILHEGLEEIGSKAFSGCVSLKELEIPASVNKIKNYKYKGEPPVTPFEKIPDITFTVTAKTCAERFCKRNELNYKTK